MTVRRSEALRWLFRAAVFSVSLVTGLSALPLPWSLWDDGVLMERAAVAGKAVRAGDWRTLKSLAVEREVGRFRPGYWAIQWVKFGLFGHRIAWHRATGVIAVWVTLGLIWWFASRLRPGTNAGPYTALFLVCFFPAGEIWYYQALAEIWQIACLAGSLVALQGALRGPSRGLSWQLAVAMLLLAPAFFCKETSVGIVPACLAAPVLFRRQGAERAAGVGPAVTYLLAIVALTGAVLAGANLGGSYASYYSLDGRVAANAIRIPLVIWSTWGLVFLVLLVSFLVRTFRAVGLGIALNGTERWQVFLLLWAAGLAGVLLPWVRPAGYLLAPAMTGLCIFMGIETASLASIVRALPSPRRRLAGTVWITLVAFHAATNLNGLHGCYRFYADRERANHDMVAEVARALERGRIVHLDVLGIPSPIPGAPLQESERVAQTDRLLRYAYGRKDFSVIPLDLGRRAFRTGEIVVTGTHETMAGEAEIRRVLGQQFSLSPIAEVERRGARILLRATRVPLLKRPFVSRERFGWRIFRLDERTRPGVRP